MQEESTLSALLKTLLGVAILAVGVLLTVSTGGFGLFFVIPLMWFTRTAWLAAGSGPATLLDKISETETVKSTSRGVEVAGAQSSVSLEKSRVKNRARRVIEQLNEQLEAGAIGQEEFELRKQSVLARAELDLDSLDKELKARLNRITKQYSTTRPTSGPRESASKQTSSSSSPRPKLAERAESGWYPDPHGLFELRYWDGSTWTENVSDRSLSATNAEVPGWYKDPRGRHELRYFDGTAWTSNVSDQGQASVESRETEG